MLMHNWDARKRTLTSRVGGYSSLIMRVFLVHSVGMSYSMEANSRANAKDAILETHSLS